MSSKACFRLLLLFAGLLCGMPVFSQHPLHTTDPKNQKPMLVGFCDRDDLMGADYMEWFIKEYEEYKIDAASLDKINCRCTLKGVKIVLVMATWCSDSRREVPRFYKIMDYLKLKPSKRMKVICVDREKKAEGTAVEQYKVDYVPTFIIYKNKKEVGRIIENPAESLEKDLQKFLSAKKT